ncbi:hypothetical protein HDA40_000711 [Hamadaea flava]|uniref:Uncharacterized protein n=1 Tax=Hamadaea flava TaxID=1742688 RepID=A0ABV8M0L2_9ACTN|nr:hypothetical protein [Hamadaea flava]MCP2322204.1 hypothetical protein [Hamadaea flava]
MTGDTAIAGWIADVPAEILADLHAGRRGPLPAPGKTTIWRVLFPSRCRHPGRRDRRIAHRHSGARPHDGRPATVAV